MAKNMISYGTRVFVQLHEKKELFSKENKIFLCGIVKSRFYRFKEEGYRVKVERKRPSSSKKDVFWVIVPEFKTADYRDKVVEVAGKLSEGYIYANYFKVIEEEISVLPNIVYLEGIILNHKTYTRDKKGNKEVNFFIKVENQEEIISCVAWNKLGVQVKNLNSGTKIKVLGRLQSKVNIEGGATREVCLSMLEAIT